eukprot:11573354-Ditylum_brightwellii.AAC.1
METASSDATPSPNQQQVNLAQSYTLLTHILVKLDPYAFPTVSQARKACEHGKIVVLQHHDNHQQRIKEKKEEEKGDEMKI